MHEFRMPKLGLGDDEELRVLEWLVSVGDAVEDGTPLLEVETDKAAMTVEADADGLVAQIVVSDGTVVRPGAVVALIASSGERIDDHTLPAVADADPSEGGSPATTTERPAPSTSSNGRPLAQVGSAQPDARPSVRHGHLTGFPPATTDLPSASGHPAPDPSLAGPSMLIELDAHRRAVARTMTASASIPQFAVARSISISPLRRQLTQLRRSVAEATITDLVIAVVGRALQEVPALNAWHVDQHVRRFDRVNLALAVDGPRGVVAPVIRDVNALAPDQLRTERARLVDLARTGRVPPETLGGATFTISNIGPLAADEITPMLTPPQVGVLGLGRSHTDPTTSEDHVRFTLVADHRTIDGADSARFLAALHDKIADQRDPS